MSYEEKVKIFDDSYDTKSFKFKFILFKYLNYKYHKVIDINDLIKHNFDLEDIQRIEELNIMCNWIDNPLPVLRKTDYCSLIQHILLSRYDYKLVDFNWNVKIIKIKHIITNYTHDKNEDDSSILNNIPKNNAIFERLLIGETIPRYMEQWKHVYKLNDLLPIEMRVSILNKEDNFTLKAIYNFRNELFSEGNILYYIDKLNVMRKYTFKEEDNFVEYLKREHNIGSRTTIKAENLNGIDVIDDNGIKYQIKAPKKETLFENNRIVIKDNYLNLEHINPKIVDKLVIFYNKQYKILDVDKIKINTDSDNRNLIIMWN